MKLKHFLLLLVSAFTLLAQAGVITQSGPRLFSATGGGSSSFQLASGHYESATGKIPLEIIAPRSGLTTANRYYKAYPGIALSLPIVPLGGAWPYKCELTTAPSGATITQTLPTDWTSNGLQNYCTLTWSNPTTAGSPHSVTALVTDQEGNTATVSWTITVTTSGFLFVDSVNGNDSNAGTLASPLASINGWYKTIKTDTTYSGYFVYYRAGSYAAIAQEGGNDGGMRMAMPDGKPKVHIAYPGESVTWDPGSATTLWYGNASGNIWVQGFNVASITAAGDQRAFGVENGPNDIMLYDNTVANQAVAGVGGSNCAFFMVRDNDSNVSTYISFVRNTINGMNGRDIFLGYGTRKVVIEGNTLSNLVGSNGHGFYAKHDSQYWDVRANKGLSSNTAEMVDADNSNTGGSLDKIWIRHNNYRTTGVGLRVGPNNSGSTAFGSLWDERNTWDVADNQAETITAGTWHATRNVVRHSGTYTDGYRVASGSVTITKTELLTGTSGLIDANGLLTGTDRTNSLGVRGHEVNGT